MPVWKRIDEPNCGFLFSLSDTLSIHEWRHPGILHPVNEGMMVMASDYSGQHKNTTHEAYTFLVTTKQSIRSWEPHRQSFRRAFLPDGRRISFKVLNEPVRKRALVPFLGLVQSLRSNIFTFLVDKRIHSFMSGGSTAIAETFQDCFEKSTRPGTVEKMFRIASFIAMLMAGLRRQDQESYWVSDHDEALDSFDRRDQLGRLAVYLTYGMTRWLKPADMHYGTTMSEYSPSWAEDVTAIADIIAGASCKLSSFLPSYCGTESWTRVVSSNNVGDWRSRTIGNWMSMKSGLMRNVLLRLELDSDGEIHTSAQSFMGAY